MAITRSMDAAPLDDASARQVALARVLAAGIADEAVARAWALIAPARRLLLLVHESPDCDTLGSALGLAHALRPLGKEAVVACADPVPVSYHFLPGWEGVVSVLPDETFDLVVALDAGELSRFGALAERHAALFAGATMLNLDHHVSSPGIGAAWIIEPRFAATAELVTCLLANRGVAIGREAAECLLAGIVTDTRAFEFDATTALTLTAGAYLVGVGAVPYTIIKPIYRMKPLAKARLWGRVLRSLESTPDGRLVWAVLRQSDLAATGATADMDDGLPSYLMDIEGVALAALFREFADGTTRISLRAAAPYDAAALATGFGGGGHVRAAGIRLHAPLDEATARVLPALRAAIGAA